jgi:hypothetical protein
MVGKDMEWWKRAVVAQLRYYPRIFLDGGTTKNLRLAGVPAEFRTEHHSNAIYSSNHRPVCSICYGAPIKFNDSAGLSSRLSPANQRENRRTNINKI